jgi:hypothetical protein
MSHRLNIASKTLIKHNGVALESHLMSGFLAGFVWYWGEPFTESHRTSRQAQIVVRHHLILGGLPPEIFDRINGFFSTDIVTYKTPAYPWKPINLVIVLKCDCKKHVSAMRQFNACAGQNDLEFMD